jgi:phosphatidylserine/phosphatidylglycerophosphate/cardiolipin synthase-like enzyme
MEWHDRSQYSFSFSFYLFLILITIPISNGQVITDSIDQFEFEMEIAGPFGAPYPIQNRYPIFENRPISFIKESKPKHKGKRTSSLPRGLFLNSKSAVAYDLLRKAKKSIDIEIYEMEDPKFRKLLLEAIRSRNVKVRILAEPNSVANPCDEMNPQEFPSDSDQCRLDKKFVKSFTELGGSYRLFARNFLCGIIGLQCWMHGKMMIIDGEVVLFSTGNFNDSSFCNLEAKPERCNQDYSYVTANVSAVHNMQGLFEFDYNATKDTANKISTHLEQFPNSLTTSPVARDSILKLLDSAKKEIWMGAQYMNNELVNIKVIELAKKRKVKVHLLLSDFCFFGRPSENKIQKIKQLHNSFDAVGIQTMIYDDSIRIKNLPAYYHAKAIVVDKKFAWLGSINNSINSFEMNREFGIFFQGEEEVRFLQKTLEEDFHNPLSESWSENIKCVLNF